MRWSNHALKEMERVPFFIRKMVKKRVEELARQQGSELVVPDHLEACRQRFMKGQEQEVRGYRLEQCFGARDCANRVLGPTDIIERLEAFLNGQDLKEFLKEQVSGPLKMHHEFRVSVSFCPNACSRPQIVDFGLIGAVRPAVSESDCTMCRACVDECGEGAIVLDEGQAPVIDVGRCLCCGHCVRACPASTLEPALEGFRVMVGGKLGRHPRLAHELPGIFGDGDVMEIVEKVMDFYRSCSRNGERLGAVINRKGLEWLYDSIGIPMGDKTIEDFGLQKKTR